MKIIIDSDIPYINGVFEPIADVVYKKGKEINHSDVRDCDAMIIRTRTNCNAELLDNSKVKFIGTATIGFDHIDIKYCESREIKVATAAGCNAMGVVHYILAALIELKKVNHFSTIGIIGVGNVGGALQEILTNLGFNVICNDPPRNENDPNFINTSMDELLIKSDIVTIHTPLTRDGQYPTYEMVNDEFLIKMGKGKILINASRGEVVKDDALLSAIEKGIISQAVIDVWQGEPNISSDLCKKAFISTPHIAGYSMQGKANGTAMMVKALTEYFDIKDYNDWYPENVVMPNKNSKISLQEIEDKMPICYDIIADCQSLKNDISQFEELRNSYNYRNEFF